MISFRLTVFRSRLQHAGIHTASTHHAHTDETKIAINDRNGTFHWARLGQRRISRPSKKGENYIIFNSIPDTRSAIGRSAVHIHALGPSAAMRISLWALSIGRWLEMFANRYLLPVDSFSDYSIENCPKNLRANVGTPPPRKGRK